LKGGDARKCTLVEEGYQFTGNPPIFLIKKIFINK